MPILLYGLEFFFLPRSDMKSSDFVVIGFVSKSFRTVSDDAVLQYLIVASF